MTSWNLRIQAKLLGCKKASLANNAWREAPGGQSTDTKPVDENINFGNVSSMNMAGHRRREAEAFEDRFAVGDRIIRYMKQQGCSKSAACEYFQSQTRLQSAALKAAHTTAKTFPPAERNRSVGYTKHQSLAQVSRKNFSCTDDEYRLGLREALSEIALKHFPVNVLNGDSLNSARNVLERAIRRIRSRRLGASNRKNFEEVRFPLVHGARAITPEDVGRLQDDA